MVTPDEREMSPFTPYPRVRSPMVTPDEISHVVLSYVISICYPS